MPNVPNQKNPVKNAPPQGVEKKDAMGDGMNKPGEQQPIEKQGEDKRDDTNVRSPDSDQSKSDRRS